MEEYIRTAILKGILETLEMTAFASLFAYLVGLPLGILLYTTSKGRIYENKAINTVVGAIVNVSRSLPFLILRFRAVLHTARGVDARANLGSPDTGYQIHSRCIDRNQGFDRTSYHWCNPHSRTNG